MVEWPLKAAQKSGLFSSIIISTEDDEIADVALQGGATEHFLRPTSLADDFASTADVLFDVLQRWQTEHSVLPMSCCCLYGTSALVTPFWLALGLEQLHRNGIELVMAVAQYRHPIERSLQFDEDGTVFYRQPDYFTSRTQDIKPSYHDIGLFYWFSPVAFMRKGGKSFLPLAKSAIIVPTTAAIDIDNEEDWVVAELLANAQGLVSCS